VATSDVREQLQTALGAQYTLERELGRGGMATVYLAQDTKHHRAVALKVLHADLAASLGPERFRREIELAARLQYPHILSVYDSGETPSGQLWFTMMYVDGESLRDRLRREHQLPLEEAVRITREAALALNYAHEHGAPTSGPFPATSPRTWLAGLCWPMSGGARPRCKKRSAAAG
jgi:serine/threonine-protein kinase